MKHKFLKFFLPILAAILIIAGFFIFKSSNEELRHISSDEELYSIYNGSGTSDISDGPLLRLLTMPFSFLIHGLSYNDCPYCDYVIEDYDMRTQEVNGADTPTSSADSSKSGTSNDYSTTNIQVENVDEADIIKNDGNYIYSLSGTDVVITDVRDTSNPNVIARITSPDDSAPVDLILADDTLTVISSEYSSSNIGSRRRYYYRSQSTFVRVYDIKDRENPRLEKNYKLNEPYYTSRRIDNQLYVIASGYMQAKNSKVMLEYEEDYVTKTFPSTNVRYLKDAKSNVLTIISRIDLNKLDSDVSIDPLLLDISNAYVSENAFYLLNKKYEYTSINDSLLSDIGKLFGLKGIIGYFEYKDRYSDYSDYGYKTEIYKFDIKDSGETVYSAKTKVDGSTINQYSLDEKDGHLRIALEDSDGSFIAILDEKLNIIGESGRLAKNEKMYASRFIGDKAYLVTYRNTDPLFVIDLSNETSPKVLGELKIPGYSVYLHPYDETHLIGIGVDTEEETRRDNNGRILWTTAYITGMKLALFDVSDVKNPKEISKVKIGDSYTTSAILTNPKALLFSKEKQLLAIPVNNYVDEFKLEASDVDDDISDLVYVISKDDSYVSEGYLVYNINLEDGITEKGSIVHENSNLIRGAYINDNLITVSEEMLKINKLADLKPISELNLSK